jgi:hypothetical protein
VSSDGTRLTSQSDVPLCIAGENPADVLGMQVAPAEPVHMAAKLDPTVEECGRHLGVQRRGSAGRIGAVEDDHRAHLAEERRHPLGRERPERDDLEQADAISFAA